MPESTETVPRYLQIAHHYRDRIMSGSLRPGDEIPSERRIADEWQVARPTAARALLTLRHEGLTESRPGSGTYVTDGHVHRHVDEHHRRPRSDEGAQAPGEHTRIIEAGLVAAAPAVADDLRLGVDGEVIRRHRVVRAGEAVVEVSTSWYPADLAEAAPRLLHRARIREGTTTYIEQATGRRAEYARDHVTARSASVGEHQELELTRPGAAVLVVRHVVYDGHDLPLEVAEAVHPPDSPALEREYPLT